MRATYCACVPNTHLTTGIRAKSLSNSCSCCATCRFLSVVNFRFFDRIQTCQHPSTVMTDNSSPPGTPPPPRSPLPGPSGSQVQEAIDLPRALSVAENLLLAIREAQPQTRAPRTQGKLGFFTPVKQRRGGSRAKCYRSTPLLIGV